MFSKARYSLVTGWFLGNYSSQLTASEDIPAWRQRISQLRDSAVLQLIVSAEWLNKVHPEGATQYQGINNSHV